MSLSTRHEALLDDLAAGAERAADSAGGWEDRHYRLGGMAVRLRFAGSRLVEPMTLALAHLEIPASESPQLTVRVWDSETTCTEPPRPRWGNDAYRERGVIDGYFERGLYTLFEWGTRTLNVLDAPGGEGFFWIASPSGLGMPEWGAPLRSMLHLWLGERGVQMVHAAAVGRPEGAVALVGGSGAGKSTTSLSCLRSDLRLLGEDYCIVEPGSPPEVSSVYGTAKLDDRSMRRLPELAPLVVAAGGPGFDEKELLDLHSGIPGKLLAEAPLRALAMPRIGEGPETRAVPCSRGALLAAMAPSTMLQLAGASEETMRRLTRIVGSVPCFSLEVGSEPDGVAAAVEAMLEAA